MNSSTNSLHAQRPPTEVTAKAKRRRFTAEYKRKILQEADAYLRHLLSEVDEEGLTPEELAEVYEAKAQIARGEYVTLEELRQKAGL